PAAILLIPYTDLLLAVFRRARAGMSPFAPDRKHLHHRMLDIGHSHRTSVLIMYLWAAVFAGSVVWLSIVRTPLIVLVIITVGAVLALLLASMPRLRPWTRHPASTPAAREATVSSEAAPRPPLRAGGGPRRPPSRHRPAARSAPRCPGPPSSRTRPPPPPLPSEMRPARPITCPARPITCPGRPSTCPAPPGMTRSTGRRHPHRRGLPRRRPSRGRPRRQRGTGRRRRCDRRSGRRPLTEPAAPCKAGSATDRNLVKLEGESL